MNYKIILKRFVKSFVSGGIASVVVALSQAPTFGTLEQTKTWILALAVAFLTGGIMAIEKALQSPTV